MRPYVRFFLPPVVSLLLPNLTPSNPVSFSFIQSINPRVYSSVIRNLLYGAILLNVPLLLLSFALLPSSLILSSTNILSLLASACFPAGSTPWLRYLVVADAAIVLCGGVLCGGVSCCGLLEGLARDGVLPRRIFGKRWQRTGAEWVSVGVYFGLCVCELSVLSKEKEVETAEHELTRFDSFSFSVLRHCWFLAHYDIERLLGQLHVRHADGECFFFSSRRRKGPID